VDATRPCAHQKLDCFPGWTHLHLMTLPCQERQMFPLSCHFVRNLSHPRSAVMEGRTQDAKKTIVRTSGSELWSRYLSTSESGVDPLPRTVFYLGFGFQLSVRTQYSIQPCAGSICTLSTSHGAVCVPGTRYPVRVFREAPKVRKVLSVEWC